MIYSLIITVCIAVAGQAVCTQGPLVTGDKPLDPTTCERVAAEMTVAMSLSDGGSWIGEVKCVQGT